MSARAELRNIICAQAVNDQAAEAMLDAFRAEVLAEAIEAARSEYLTDNTGTPEDEAYNQGVTDAVAAIGALLASSSPSPAAGDKQPETAVEYGIYTPDRDRALGVTLSRAEAADTLITVKATQPGAVLVQRTVHYGAWTEAE